MTPQRLLVCTLKGSGSGEESKSLQAYGTLRNGTLRNGYTSANAPRFFALATKS